MNPFRETIVASPWEPPRVDVSSIHGGVFEACVNRLRQVRDSGHSGALLIHGEAGSGKTHLLSRLRALLSPREPSSTVREECLFVWVRLQTSPRLIWRTVRRTLVDDWFRPVVDGKTQFQRILFHRLAEIRPAEGDLERWYEYMLDEHPEDLAALIDDICVKLDVDRNTAVAFEHIAFQRHMRDLRAWLAGGSLPQGALERMNLAAEEGTDDEREDQSLQVVLMLCKLAGRGLPIVLSFDQVEALQTAPGDKEALFAFSQLVSTLHDGSNNVLLLSCVQSAFVTELQDFARKADYERMTSLGTRSLDPLNRGQALELISARRRAVAEMEPARDESWPLAPQEFEELMARGFVSPRRLLSLCAERFEFVSLSDGNRPAYAEPFAGEGEHVDSPGMPLEPAEVRRQSIHDHLADRWAKTCEERLGENSPELTEDIVRHALPQVVRLLRPGWKLVRDDLLPDVSLIFETPAGRIGISLCTQDHMTSLAARLKRLNAQQALDRLHRLVLVFESRRPLSQGAKVARQQLADLQRDRAMVLHPTPELLAALDALRGLLSDAKSGDLAFGGEAIAPRTVEEWLASKVPEEFVELVETLNADQPQAARAVDDSVLVDALLELLAQQRMIRLEDVSRQLELPEELLIDLIHRHPEHFGLLGQPPGTVFRAVHAPEALPQSR
ncbi:MAG: AAA family ATPase [Planctomycetales bacterium]